MAYLIARIMAMFAVLTIVGRSVDVILVINAFIPPILMFVVLGFIMAANDKYKGAGKEPPSFLTGTLCLVLFIWILFIISMILWTRG